MLLLDGGKIAVGHGSSGPKSNSVSVCHLYFLVATRGNSIVGQGAKGIDGAVALKCFHTFPCVQVPHLNKKKRTQVSNYFAPLPFLYSDLGCCFRNVSQDARGA